MAFHPLIMEGNPCMSLGHGMAIPVGVRVGVRDRIRLAWASGYVRLREFLA